jgi:hypothetical protein
MDICPKFEDKNLSGMKTHEIDSRIKKQETQRPAYNLPTWVGIFVPGYVILYLGMSLYKYSGIKFCMQLIECQEAVPYIPRVNVMIPFFAFFAIFDDKVGSFLKN